MCVDACTCCPTTMLVTTFYHVSFTRITAITVSLQILRTNFYYVLLLLEGWQTPSRKSQPSSTVGRYLCADARWGGQARYIRALVGWSSTVPRGGG